MDVRPNLLVAYLVSLSYDMHGANLDLLPPSTIHFHFVDFFHLVQVSMGCCCC